MNSFTYINFDGDLTENKSCKITYTGLFFENNSDSVTMVYGFDDDWKERSEIEMEKTKDGFTAEIKMLNYGTFSFCFRNSNYEWDNNYYQNYVFPIAKEKIEPTVVVPAINDIFENSQSEISKIEGLGLDNIVNNVDESIASFSVDIERNDPLNIEETLVASVEESELNNDIDTAFQEIYNQDKDKQSLLNDILADSPTTNENQKFSMNSLIDEILSPIVSSSVFEEEKLEEPAEAQEAAPIAENVELASDVEEDSKVDALIDDLITSLYKNTENIVTEDQSPAEATTTEEAPIAEEVISTEGPAAEESLLEEAVKQEEPAETKTASEETALVVSPRSLSKFYIARKKIKVAFYRLLRLIPGFNTSK